MTRTRWEYMQTDTLWPKMAGEVEKMDEKWHALEIGQNGWELVTVVRTPSGTLTALFKREASPALSPIGLTESFSTQRVPTRRKGRA